MLEANIDKIDIFNLINENFYEWWYEIADKYLYRVLKGGRNSAKSTHISFRKIYRMMKYPINTLVVRKVAGTLATSVFEQLKEAICLMNVDYYWKDYKSPLRLLYKPTGQEILFRGADDPQKIKSIKTSRFPLSELWIEELSEFRSEDEVQTIVDSVVRAKLKNGLNYGIDFTYNPPKNKANWCNKKYNTQFLPSNTHVHHSTYLDNLHVSEAFIEEAEEVKKLNQNRYKWLYLGEALGGGIVPFSNLEFRTITDDEIKRFDNIKQGHDFGFSVDPANFGRQHLDKTRAILYFIDEIRAVKLKNKILADKIIERNYNDSIIIADSENPQGIDELRSYGIKIKGAKKGPGSVEYGLEWLDTLNKIVIDYKRTPGAAKEFESADYKLDRDGNQTAELDGEDHSIDQTRYSLENDMKNKVLGWKERNKAC
jgi:PBSX family phage terminase large subunit